MLAKRAVLLLAVPVMLFAGCGSSSGGYNSDRNIKAALKHMNDAYDSFDGSTMNKQPNNTVSFMPYSTAEDKEQDNEWKPTR